MQSLRPVWPVLLVWPVTAHADGSYGSAFIAIFACGIVAFGLGVIAIVRRLSLKARRSVIGCGAFLTWMALVLSNAIDASSTGDLMFRALLLTVIIMPVPFIAGFAVGMTVRHVADRRSRNKDDA